MSDSTRPDNDATTGSDLDSELSGDLSPEQVELARQAADPTTDLTVLHSLAARHPELRPVIALNPATYPQLLDWLAGLDDEDVRSALHYRAEVGPIYPTEERVDGGDADGSDADGSDADGSDADDTDAGRDGGEETATTVLAAPVIETEPTEVGAAAVSEDSAASQPAPRRDRGAAAAGLQSMQPTSQSTNRGLVIAVVALTVIALLLAGLTVWQWLRPISDTVDDAAHRATASATAETSPTATEQPTPTVSATPTPTETEKKDPYPAPEGAASVTEFQSPTGNLRCALSGGELVCQAVEIDDEIGDVCDDDTLVITATESGASENCQIALEDGNYTILDYDTAANFGDFACWSRYRGVTCWNTKTGNSFAFSRAGFQTGSGGAIAEDSFNWAH